MSVYSVKGKGWRYDFTLKGNRYTEAWFKTKTEAKQAEAEKRKELKNPKIDVDTPIDMEFLDLVNLRLDYLKDYSSEIYYKEYIYKAKCWVKLWGNLNCNQINSERIQKFVSERKKVSPQTANKEIRYLKATFNYGIKNSFITTNPVKGIKFYPIEERFKYVPSQQVIEKVIAEADSDTQDYLLTIKETLGRMIEINRLKWTDVNFDGRFVVLYTRKKRGGNLTPRKIPMTKRLYNILKNRYENRDNSIPWVFWHSYKSLNEQKMVKGPYKDRKKIMKTLCRKADVQYFRFHALRHSGASTMENLNIPIGSIQRILGHENRTTTEIYLHSINESERIAMDILERGYADSHTDSHTDQQGEINEKHNSLK
jgi:integrase